MLKLCGFGASNYYNKVKLALLEKGVSFEEELAWVGETDPSASPPEGEVRGAAQHSLHAVLRMPARQQGGHTLGERNNSLLADHRPLHSQPFFFRTAGGQLRHLHRAPRPRRHDPPRLRLRLRRHAITHLSPLNLQFN